MNRQLTQTLACTLAQPETGNRLYYDSEVNGFAVRVTAAGKRAFVLNYRTLKGRERRITIGDVGDWPIDAARSFARAMRRQIDQGGDPMEDRRT